MFLSANAQPVMTHGISPDIIFKRIDDFAQGDIVEQTEAMK